MEAPNLCWVEVIGSSGDENLTDDAILPARSLLQRVYEPLSSLSAAEGGVLPAAGRFKTLRDSHRPKLQRQKFFVLPSASLSDAMTPPAVLGSLCERPLATCACKRLHAEGLRDVQQEDFRLTPSPAQHPTMLGGILKL